MFQKKSVFDKIENHLKKKGHQLCMSIFLSNYNGNNIYVRFDYVPKYSVYKIVWFDFNFFDEKHIEDYINIQTVTKILSMRLVNLMTKQEYVSDYAFNEKIMGDRVEILSYFKDKVYEFVFDRFLPLEWKFLIDPLAIIFSYLPRSMEVFLNEIFALFDGTSEKYNSLKPVKFDLIDGDDDKMFKPQVILSGTKYYEDDRVEFLEKIDDHYLAIVEGSIPYLVNIRDDNDGYVFMWCSCKTSGYCKHIYATILAIRDKKFKPFYKVIYKGKDETLLEKVMASKFFLCFGIEGDQLLLITAESMIFKADIMVDGTKVFEVIEDDDDLSLSKALDKYK